MIARVALRRFFLLATKQQVLTKQQVSSSLVRSRYLHSTLGVSRCDDPIEPALAETLSSNSSPEASVEVEEGLDIDAMFLQSADAAFSADELTFDEEKSQEVDEGNFNYDEMLLNSAVDDDPEGLNFDVEKVEDEDEENFNYDEMILNSAVDDADFDTDGDVDVDSFLSRQSDDIRADILGTALDYVPQHGWTMESIQQAIGHLEVDSSTTSNMFKHGGLDLLLFFIEEANNSLIEYLAKQSKEKKPTTEEERAVFIEDAMKRRLQLIIPYIDTWPQALTLMASPQAAREVFENGANLMDEIWYHAGDMDTDITWYAKRAALAGISASAELFMLNDKSPEYRDTWDFLHRRLNDARVVGGVKDSLSNAAGDTIALVTSGITTAQNILGLGSKGPR